MKHFSGVTWWTYDEGDCPVDDAIVTDTLIAFDVTYERKVYTVKLTPDAADPSSWSGAWTMRDGKQGDASARLYRNDQGIVLVGRWHEYGQEHAWFTELLS
jgi:hypothetical protein